LGESDQKSFGSTDVAEPVRVLSDLQGEDQSATDD